MASSAQSAADAVRAALPTSLRGRVIAAVVVLVAAAGALGLARRHPPTERGPGLVVRVREKTPTDDAGAGGVHEDRAMSLALACTTPVERLRILDEMRYTTARLEARLSPLGDDLDDDAGDAMELFHRGVARYTPLLTAARAIEGGAWRSDDLEVRVVASCEGAARGRGETCVPLWRSGRDRQEPPEAERARFLAWAVSRAALVDLGTPARSAACAEGLRASLRKDESTISLVIGAGDLAIREVPERPELEEAARKLGRAMAANRIDDDGELDAFVHATPSGRVAPWLTLEPATLLVAPRLSALVRTSELAREIEDAPSCAGARFVHRP